MKQLKFMLAAATAIGLATASQAAEQTTKLVDNENFDSATVGAAATTLMGYSYAGATAADNESVVKAGGYNGSANALQVNTGTDPLLRALSQLQGSAQALDLASYKSVYIDTMVQFTVTPAGDTVTAGEDDKLMIYLKEVPAVTDDGGNVTTPASTKLIVKALEYKAGSSEYSEELEDFIVTEPVANVTESEVTYEDRSAVAVTAGTWYRLRVDTVLVDGVPMFTIKLNDALIVPAEKLHLAGETGSPYFPSLLGTADTTLQYVGFAGEGLVDNLTVATVKEVTTVDFTIAWNADGFSAVTYTINGGSALTPVNGVKFTINLGDDIVITPVLADWYKRTDSSALTYTDVAAASTSVALTAAKTAEVDASGNVAVTEGTTATDLGITAGGYAGVTDTTVLGNLMTWATAATKGGATAANAASLVNSMTFDANDNPTSDAAKAYLLDCATGQVEAEADKFKLTISFDENGAPVVTGPDGSAETYKNGNIVLKGRASLSEGEWATADSAAHNFFKAFLTK